MNQEQVFQEGTFIDNTADGIKIALGDILYYDDKTTGDRKYCFATNQGIRTMEYDDSLIDVLTKGKPVSENEPLHLSNFSLFKRLIRVGLLTPVSLREYDIQNHCRPLSSFSTVTEDCLRDILKHSLLKFKELYNCPIQFSIVGQKAEGLQAVIFYRTDSEEILFEAPMIPFLHDLFDEIDVKPFIWQLDFFVARQFDKYKGDKSNA